MWKSLFFGVKNTNESRFSIPVWVKDYNHGPWQNECSPLLYVENSDVQHMCYKPVIRYSEEVLLKRA